MGQRSSEGQADQLHVQGSRYKAVGHRHHRSLRRISLLVVLQPGGHQDQAPVGPEARLAEVGRLPGEDKRELHREPDQDGRLVRRHEAVHQSERLQRQILCPQIYSGQS